jgi:hypothetical protein
LPAEPTFLSKLGDLGTIQLPTAAAPDPALLDPLPSLDPPEDQRLIRARDAAASTPGRGAFHVTGVVGAAAALVALELHQQRKSPVVCVAEDGDAAQKLAADLAFLLGLPEPGLAASEVLLLPPYENTPYAEVNPDRRAMLGRLATLAHLALKRPFRFLVRIAGARVCTSQATSSRVDIRALMRFARIHTTSSTNKHGLEDTRPLSRRQAEGMVTQRRPFDHVASRPGACYSPSEGASTQSHWVGGPPSLAQPSSSAGRHRASSTGSPVTS